jgi:hypothetical protein
VRRWILFLAVGSALYGFARFDVVLLPVGAWSPLYGVHAGDRLLVDRHTKSGFPGALWLFHDPKGTLLLGREGVPPPDLAPEARAALEAGARWLCFDRPVPELEDSATLGPIAASACAGRVLFVLPW